MSVSTGRNLLPPIEQIYCIGSYKFEGSVTAIFWLRYFSKAAL